MDRVFVDLHVVGHGRQRAELQTEFVLRGGDFVVVLFDHGAHRGHGGEHFTAHVLGRIHRRDGEVAALGADAVAEVAAFVLRVHVGRQFDAVEHEAHCHSPGHLRPHLFILTI